MPPPPKKRIKRVPDDRNGTVQKASSSLEEGNPTTFPMEKRTTWKMPQRYSSAPSSFFNVHTPSLPYPSYWNLPSTSSSTSRGHSSVALGNNALQIGSCHPPYDQFFCFNGGQCFRLLDDSHHYPFVQSRFLFCRCAPNFHGHQCEYLFDSNFYRHDLNMTNTNNVMMLNHSVANGSSHFANSSSFSSNSSPSLLLLLILLISKLLFLFRPNFFR